MIKEGVAEALAEMLPEIVSMIQEGLSAPIHIQSNSLVEATQNDDRLSLIRQKYREANPNSGVGYSDLPKPENPKAIVNGETFASGKGILEWFSETKNGESKTTTKVSEKKMEEFMAKKFGVK